MPFVRDFTKKKLLKDVLLSRDLNTSRNWQVYDGQFRALHEDVHEALTCKVIRRTV